MTSMVVKQKYFILFFLIVFACSNRDTYSSELRTIIYRLIDNFNGDASIYFRHSSKDIEFGIDEHEIYPASSLIKIPVMVKIFDKIEKGVIDLDSAIIYQNQSINYPNKGDGILVKYKDGETVTIRKLLYLMTSYSDNHASLLLQNIAGGGQAINDWLELNGFENTRVNSGTVGREDDYNLFGWGQTSAKEMCELLRLIREGKIISKNSSERMYRYLSKSYWDGEALSEIPPTIQVASKQGAINSSRSEVVFVNTKNGGYVFCILTKNQIDKSWVENNEGFELIRQVSKILWDNIGYSQNG